MSVSLSPPMIADEKKVLNVINQAAQTAKQSKPNDKAYKNFNIHIFNEEMEEINALRELRPRPRRGTRLGISIHDWIIEAIQEKIEREKRKLKT